MSARTLPASDNVERPPSAFRVHLALACGQVCLGGGPVVGKLGIHGANPVLFCLIREGTAGPLLLLISWLTARVVMPPREDACRLVAAGFALMSNQIMMIVGLKLASPLAGAAWQPSQPIFTLALAACLGQEVFTLRKALGISVAVCGACFMVLWGAASADPAQGSPIAGHLCFCVNCSMTSCYILLTKPLVRRHAAISVQAWTYVLGSCMVFAIALVVSTTPALLRWLCRDEDAEVQQTCIEGAWSVPQAMVLPLAYWIVFVSMIGYYAMVWANRHMDASTVSVYTVVQPVTTGLISAVLILTLGSSWADRYGMTYPGTQDLGIFGIVLGLLILFSESSGKDSNGDIVPLATTREPLRASAEREAHVGV